MYYVIKKQENVPLKCFIGFAVPKYIAGKDSENVIFEFMKDGKPQRKWIKKADIVLLTDDKKFFMQTMDKFKKTEEEQQKLVEMARDELDKSIENFSQTMESEINEFNEIKNSDDIPDILKNL